MQRACEFLFLACPLHSFTVLLREVLDTPRLALARRPSGEAERNADMLAKSTHEARPGYPAATQSRGAANAAPPNAWGIKSACGIQGKFLQFALPAYTPNVCNACACFRC